MLLKISNYPLSRTVCLFQIRSPCIATNASRLPLVPTTAPTHSMQPCWRQMSVSAKVTASSGSDNLSQVSVTGHWVCKKDGWCYTSTRFSCVLTTLDWECFKYREPIKNKTFLFSAKLKSLVSYEYSKISMIDNNVFDHENHGGIIVVMLYALFT